MNSNIDFNELWASQKTAKPNKAALMAELNKFKKTNLTKMIALNLVLVATALFVVYILWSNQAKLLTTKIGAVLIVLAIVIFVIANNKLIVGFKNISGAESNKAYLENLLAVKSKQLFMQTTVMNLYFILLPVGMGLCMYEYARKMTLPGAIFTYTAFALWIAFNWFYLRPRQIKKQRNLLDGMIHKFQLINDQLIPD